MPAKGTQIMIMLTALILIPTLALKRHRNFKKSEKVHCENYSCVLANNISNKMDRSIDPCEDFYSYACNGWINARRMNWNTFKQVNEQNQMVIKRVFDESVKNPKSVTEQKARIFYKSCLDLESIKKLNAKPMLAVIRKLGGWSFSSGFRMNRKWSFQKMVQRVRSRYVVDAFFDYSVAPDSRNSVKYILHINRSKSPLEQLIDDHMNLFPDTVGRIIKLKQMLILYILALLSHGYLNLMTHLGGLLGGGPIPIRKPMENVFEFEVKIINMTFKPSSTFLTLKELNEKVKFVDWVAFFKNEQRVFNWKFDMQQEIDVHGFEYFKELSQLIEEYLKTDEGKTVLNDYLVWETVMSLAHALPKSFMDIPSIYPNSDIPQWKKCVEETQFYFSFATSTVFAREAFPSDSKKHAEEIFKNILNGFSKTIQDLQWMSENAKKASINKLNSISFTIGLPDIFENLTRADNSYESILIRENAYFQNILKMRHHWTRNQLERLKELVTVEDNSFTLNFHKASAHFDQQKNHIRIFPGILQNPFYDPRLPLSLNYGGIGVIMGHELAHIFGDEDRCIMKNGSLNPLWDHETEKKFYNITKCFPGEYDKGVKDFVEESVSDNGGIKSAFRAYLDLTKDKPEPEMLPNLGLNHKQLFFVAFAQTWCSSVDETYEMEYSSHPPSKARVNGVLRNNEYFGREFGCKIGTNMNPPSKCELW